MGAVTGTRAEVSQLVGEERRPVARAMGGLDVAPSDLILGKPTPALPVRATAYTAEPLPATVRVYARSATQLAAAAGYDEVNLNVGCPSDRVQSGQFGACLMARPQVVADCFTAMTAVSDVPVTVKTRIGIDDRDSYEFLVQFVQPPRVVEDDQNERNDGTLLSEPEPQVSSPDRDTRQQRAQKNGETI